MKPAYLLLILLIAGQACQPLQNYPDPLDGKVKGLVFTGPGRGPLYEQMFSSMQEVGGNFVALVPEATVYRQNLKVIYDFENQWFGERKAAVYDGIALARAQGLKVMLKPHLTIGWDMSSWLRPEVDFEDSLSRIQYTLSAREFVSSQQSKVEGKGSWRGVLMTSEEDWPTFEEGYTDFILDYAQIADSLGVELFCIGTEMKRTALEKPEFWRRLIKKVRAVYQGPLVYAANWDSYNQITFWDELDYIGVDAYFPLSEAARPSLDEMKEAWINRKNDLLQLVRQYKKPMLLTEWGYENEDYVGAEPWIMGRYKDAGSQTNEEAQAQAYQSFFETVWDEPWMKGVFVWRWSPGKQAGTIPNYSPRGKLAEKELQRWFK